MSTVKVVSSTMGQSSPASAAEGREGGWYKYKRDPRWKPNDGRYPEDPAPAAPAATEAVISAREERYRKFCGYRDEGKTVAEAGDLLEVTITTARAYERERKAEIRGAGEQRAEGEEAG